MITHIQSILAADPSSSPLGGIWFPMLLMFVMMYFIMIRPQQKKQKEQRDMLENLKIGDEVITAGGIHGIVANKSDRTVTVKVQDGVKIKFEKSSVTQVFKTKGKEGEAGKADDQEAQEEQNTEEEKYYLGGRYRYRGVISRKDWGRAIVIY